MASFGTTQRPNTISSTTSDSDQQPYEPKQDSTSKTRYDSIRPEFNLVCPFNIPSTPEAAAARIIKNLSHFSLYYAHFLWIILLITLIPQRKDSLICLVITTYVASVYMLLLRALPLLYKFLDKRIVLTLLALATMVELILTNAAIHLFLTLAAATPLVLLHAVLWIREDEEIANDAEVLLPVVADQSTAMV